MDTHIPQLLSVVARKAIFASLLSLSLGLQGATLTDFGYQHNSINGRLPIGGRPLLVILACFDTNGPTACFSNFEHDWQYYHELVFSFTRTPVSMNGYFHENSNGRFSWTPVDTELGVGAGVTKVWVNSIGCLECPGVTGVGYYSNVVAQAMKNVRFADYDTNHDGVVTQDEMAIAIINSDFKSGGTRDAGIVHGEGIAFRGQVSNLGYFVTFDTWCHEMSHSLGTVDLYGTNCSSYTLTLMSCSGIDVNNRSWHLDPWHKMQLGWSEPRIRLIGDGGIESIPAAQLMEPAAPIILYDPSRGVDEYFILEYRTPISPNGPGFDGDVASYSASSRGLVIWRVKQSGSHAPVFAGGNPVVWSDGVPSLLHGGSALWEGDMTTPELRYLDGASTGARVHVLPFTPGSGAIRVEWMAPRETWVDFSYDGPESGLFNLPFNTVAEGVLASSYGGTIHIKAGTSSELLNITKRVTLQAYNGPCSIGRR